MKKLLIIHQGALGDVITTYPALLRLKEPFTSLDILCQNQIGKLTCKLGIADQSYPIESASYASLYSDSIDSGIARFLQSFEIIILFSFSEYLENNIRRITRKTIHRIPPRPPASERIPIAEYILKQLNNLHLISNEIPLWVYADKRNADADTKRILIHAGSGSVKKNWSIENYKKIADLLQAEEFKPSFILGNAEYQLLSELKTDVQRIVYQVSDLSQLLEIVKSSGCFIGNDSGISHLAAFSGLPAIVLFGPSDPLRWKPVGRIVKVVKEDIDCSPCFETDANHCQQRVCLENISIDKVMSAFHSITNDK